MEWLGCSKKGFELSVEVRTPYLTDDGNLFARFYLADAHASQGPNSVHYQFLTPVNNCEGLFEWLSGLKPLDLTDAEKASTEFLLDYLSEKAALSFGATQNP